MLNNRQAERSPDARRSRMLDAFCLTACREYGLSELISHFLYLIFSGTHMAGCALSCFCRDHAPDVVRIAVQTRGTAAGCRFQCWILVPALVYALQCWQGQGLLGGIWVSQRENCQSETCHWFVGLPTSVGAETSLAMSHVSRCLPVSLRCMHTSCLTWRKPEDRRGLKAQIK